MGENTIRVGLGLVFVSAIVLTGTSFGNNAGPILWLALIVFFIETLKDQVFDVIKATWGEVIIAVSIAILALKGLLGAFGQSLSDYHLFLGVLFVGGLVILYGANKKLG